PAGAQLASGSGLREPPNLNGLLVTPDWHVAEGHRAFNVADLLVDDIRNEELRPELPIQSLDSRGEVHRVADHALFLAPRGAAAASYHVPEMQADADAQRPVTSDIVLLDGREHLAAGGHGACRRVRIVEWCAEQRQKAVAEKFVHDATIAVDDVDQHSECGIESVHNLLRRPLTRWGGEVANVDEHDGYAPGIGGGC